jgi:3-hydroxybutyryl-CoA dehydrogenase
VMESVYRQYYDEARYRPSVITAQRLAGKVLGRKTGEGFYRYVDGKAQVPAEPPFLPWPRCRRCGCRPAPPAAPSCTSCSRTWAPRWRPASRLRCRRLTLVAPLGFDVTTVAVVERLDPARTRRHRPAGRGRATKRRVLATNPATRADMRDAAHACSRATARR